MNLYWRITKTALLGIILPAGVLCFGYLWLGPNMRLLPRLDPDGWKQVKVERLKSPDEQKAAVQPAQAQPAKYNISVESEKQEGRRRRRRTPTYTVLVAGTEVKPADATAEVATPEGTLTAN